MKIIKNFFFVVTFLIHTTLILKPYTYDFHFIGAGILPYCQKNGAVLFLVGKDHHRSWCFSDFGGAKNAGETPRQTAAREGYEETMGMIGSQDFIFQNIKNNQPFIYKNGQTYYEYLIKIDFILEQKFIEKRNDPKLPYPFREKIDFAWIRLNDLIQAIQNNNLSIKDYKDQNITLYDRFVKTLNTLSSVFPYILQSTTWTISKNQMKCSPA